MLIESMDQSGDVNGPSPEVKRLLTSSEYNIKNANGIGNVVGSYLVQEVRRVRNNRTQ